MFSYFDDLVDKCIHDDDSINIVDI